MLEKLFTSKTRTKILMLLMFQDKEYHLREIARNISVSPIYVSKELENLAEINLVRKVKKANLNLYSLNKKSIILPELKSMFLKTDYLGEVLKESLQNKADYVFIFGSFAKGREKEASDIDLFIISEIKEEELLPVIQKLEKTANREINYILWGKKTFRQRAAAGHHLLRTIKQEKIMMLLGDEDVFKEQIR